MLHVHMLDGHNINVKISNVCRASFSSMSVPEHKTHQNKNTSSCILTLLFGLVIYIRLTNAHFLNIMSVFSW